MNLEEFTRIHGGQEATSRAPGASLVAAAVEERIALCAELGRALHRYGTPAHTLEDQLTRLSRALGVPGQFFATPTAIFAAFRIPGRRRAHTELLRAAPGGVDLGRLARVQEIHTRLLDGDLEPAAAHERVREVLESPPLYGPILRVAGYALSSGAATRFLGGGLPEIAVASGIGLTIGLLAQVVERTREASPLFPPVAALVASLLALGAAALAGPHAVNLAILGGLIVLLPGLTLTVAIKEIATENLVSGTARLVQALGEFLGLALGTALGSQLGARLFAGATSAAPAPVADWTVWLALLVAPLAFTVLFRARPADAGWILLAGWVAYGGARLGSALLGAELGVFVGALSVGVASNVYARWLGRSSLVPMVPGITLLVPGSMGFRSLAALLDHDVVSGIETAFQVGLVAIALVTGLLLANFLVPTRGRSAGDRHE